jgi:hypothetical protein
MEPRKPNQGQPTPDQGNRQDSGRRPGGEERVDQVNPDRSRADEQPRRTPGDEPAIPELPEPDVEGVGSEGEEDGRP